MPGRSLRILYISPEFAPLADSEAFCSAKMALALHQQGAEVVVLHDPGILSRKGAKIDGSSMWEGVQKFSVPVGEPEDRNWIAEAYYGIRYQAFQMRQRWVAAVVKRAVALHAEKPFDLVYSRSLPLRAHIAGYWCAWKIAVPWIAHADDPEDYGPSPGGARPPLAWVRDTVSNYWLRKTLKSADVFTVSCRRRGRYTAALAGVRRRVDVIPHVGCAAPLPGRVEKFHLVHAGALGRNELANRQSSIFLLIGLARFLEDHPNARSVTKLRFVGPRDLELNKLASDLGLNANVESTRVLSYENSLKEIAAAAACVLVEADMEEGIDLPSSLADYVVAGKPVLAMSPEVGMIADLLPEPGIVRVGPEDADGVARALSDLYADFQSNNLSTRKPSEKLVRMFDAGTVAKAFLARCEKLVPEAAPSSKPAPEPSSRAEAEVFLKPASRTVLGGDFGRVDEVASPPLVSFIILTRNRRDMVVRAIASASAQRYPSKEIIVVNNGSTDGTAKLVHASFPNVHVMSSRTNIALTTARNNGIRESKGEFIVLMDDDCVLNGENCTEPVVKNFLADEECGAVAFRIADPLTGDEWPYNLYEGDRPPMAYECGVFRAGGVALRRKALEDVGLFWDPLFFVHEDTELALRIITAGWRIIARSDIIMWHPALDGRGPRNLKRDIYYKVRNTTWFALKALPFSMLPGLFFPTFTRSLIMALRTGAAPLFVQALIDSGRGASDSLRDRRPLTRAWIKRARKLSLKLWM